ncbi:ABC-type Zn uptake system ZnuABC Zn-binding protein ZnuA [Clostridium algifaecis]|uniref:ABC-type Zn uptake system ZnuABC Zn-binding protein ZnuA n=1 Tax=Clostridium algifaecis TaxID=1472040 RepID=A0ABS4KUW2_9CLOT|nr:zinc ABC transporter substrate-binding protein [Clostridium algifaecis]MBP2033156.1 ABC-type Zn uptake system ZnuABC Zn-binding protein ZnuA [Clostridium algifaecis]
MKKSISLIMLILLIVLTACNSISKNKDQKSNTHNVAVNNNVNLDIVTTDKLLYTIVKTIVKDKHTINYMFKDRQSEINFKFTYDSLNNISKKDLFIYVCPSFEIWVDDFIDKLDKSKVGIINSSRGVKLLAYNHPLKYKNITVNENPYYFMDIDNYKIMLVNIKNAVEDKDPKNRSFYEKIFSSELKNLQSYESNLKSIDESLSDYKFIISNENLKYFTNYSKLELLDIASSNNVLSSDDIKKEIDQNNSNNKIVFLYTDDSELNVNSEILKTYGIKPVKLQMFNGNYSYENTIKQNIKSLNSIISK